MEKAEFITKIEGHGSLHFNWGKNKVWLEVAEGERLFEGMVVGRPAEDLYWITPRICGVCPIAHNLAAIKAVEDALNIKPGKSTILLRKLLLDAQMIQSHTLHLYFLAAPDYLGLDSGLEIIKTHPVYFQQALELKRISDLLADKIGGRGIHPMATAAGGFRKVPSIETLKMLKKEAVKMLLAAQGTFNLFSSLVYPEVSVNLNLFSLTNGKTYDVYDAKYISSNKKLKVRSENYQDIIEEKIKDYSTAKFGYHKKKGMMVGSLARLNLQGNLLKGEAKKLFKEALVDFKNPYHNNLAQAIETYHFAAEANEILDILIQTGIDSEATSLPKDLKPGKNSVGVGALEAPRGGLYYEVRLNTKGLITRCNIVTPTVQNLSSIEETAQIVLDQNRGQSKERIQDLLEMLVRAYDPCITCSVH